LLASFLFECKIPQNIIKASPFPHPGRGETGGHPRFSRQREAFPLESLNIPKAPAREDFSLDSLLTPGVPRQRAMPSGLLLDALYLICIELADKR
jgi:hypothetical protein